MKSTIKINRQSFNVTDLQLINKVDYSVNRDFKLGQYVTLNSGGPKMMVLNTFGNDIILCYLDENQKPIELTINRNCLTPI